MMHYRILDASRVTDRPSLHAELRSALELPDYYGRNLDALYDCLTDIFEPVTLLIVDADRLEPALGDYADKLIATLKDAAEENLQFSFRCY